VKNQMGPKFGLYSHFTWRYICPKFQVNSPAVTKHALLTDDDDGQHVIVSKSPHVS
jgi:hypothetical protein